MSQRDNEMLALARRAGQECKALGLRIDALESAGDAVELSGISTTGFTDGRMIRIASGGGIEERTPAQVLSDIGAAASGHTHAQLHDAATVSGNGIQISGQQISLSIGTGATQVAAGNHNHSGVYQPVLTAYSTIAALSGYPTAFPTSASQISDSTAAGRALLTFATPASAKYLRINANGTVTALTAEELAVEMFSADSSSRRHWPLYYTLVRTTTASGGSVPNAGLGTVAVSSGTTSGGLAIARITGDVATDSELTYPGDAMYKLNFDRRHRIRMTVALHLAAGTGTGWMIFGAPYNLASGAAPAQKGFGLKFTTAGVALWVHNGTTLTVAAATAMTLATYAEIALDFWAGTLSGSLNGVALDGASSGPTGLSATDNGVVAMVAYSPATSDNMRIQISHPTSLTTAN